MKRVYLLVLVIFGFFTMPSNAFACENNSAKNTSRKEISSKMSCNNNCCKKDAHAKNKNSEGCGGKCKHSKCGCVSTSNTSVSINEWDINTNCFNFSSAKQKFYNYETTISSGFNSLWLIPKIS